MINKDLYRETFSKLHTSPDTRRNIMNMTQKKRVPKRLGRTALIAAALVAALTMSAYAAFQGGLLQNLPSLLAQSWQKNTKQELNENQIQLIDSLTQRIDQSVTVGDVTVTLDSITVGDGVVWAYLYATGPKFAIDGGYRFGFDMGVTVTPAPDDNHFGSFWTIWNDDESVLHISMCYDDSRMEDTNFADGTHTLELFMSDLISDNAKDESEKVVQAGTWAFSVPLTEKSVSPVLTLDCPEAGITNLQISSTGIRFQTDREVYPRVVATLKDGTEVKVGLNGGFHEGSGTYRSSWPAPLNISEIVSVRIEDVEIPVN